MNERQEKRRLLCAFNELTRSRSQGILTMALILYQENGLQCALDFIVKMKEYDLAEKQEAPL